MYVRGGGFRATLDLGTGNVLAGELPARLRRRVRRWVAARRDALEEAYFAALGHQDPATIKARFEEQTREV